MNEHRGHQSQTERAGHYNEDEAEKGYQERRSNSFADDSLLSEARRFYSPSGPEQSPFSRTRSDSLTLSKRAIRTRFRRPVLVIVSLVMMATLLWLTHVLLFLVPSFSSLGQAAVVSSPSSPTASTEELGRSSLGQFALQKILADSAGVFGLFEGSNATTYTSSPETDQNGTNKKKKKSHHRSTWMSLVPDSTPLSQINIPGTHDSATWNFTQTTANSIRHNADPANGVLPAVVYRCQHVSLLDALNGGVRFFDLRYGLDPEGVRLVFYHAHALLSDLATVEDVLFGFYTWLEAHPSEVVLLSFKIEVSTFAPIYISPHPLTFFLPPQSTGINTTPPDHLKTQTLLLQSLTTPAAKHYISQRHDVLGTLGPARGKIILLRRFDNPLDGLPPGTTIEPTLPGIHLSPSAWPDNAKTGFSLTYNPEKNLSAQIEDYYEPNDLPSNSTAEENVAAKLRAVEGNLRLAAAGGKGGEEVWYITFTSAENNANHPAVTPNIMALGNGTEVTPQGGVNGRLVREVFPTLRGKGLGVLVIDFWDLLGLDEGGEEGDVVGAFLDL